MKKFSLSLTYKQYKWLTTQGDRTIEDVFVYQGNPFIYLDGKKVYIPNNEDICIIGREDHPTVAIC